MLSCWQVFNLSHMCCQLSDRQSKYCTYYVIFVTFYKPANCKQWMSLKMKICCEKCFVRNYENQTQTIWITQQILDCFVVKIWSNYGHPTPQGADKLHFKMMISSALPARSPRRAARLGIILMVFSKNCRNCCFSDLTNKCKNIQSNLCFYQIHGYWSKIQQMPYMWTSLTFRVVLMSSCTAL